MLRPCSISHGHCLPARHTVRHGLMPQLMYIMQFKGYAGPVGTTPHVLQVITIASSCTITTAIGAEGVHGAQQLTEGGQGGL